MGPFLCPNGEIAVEYNVSYQQTRNRTLKYIGGPARPVKESSAALDRAGTGADWDRAAQARTEDAGNREPFAKQYDEIERRRG